MFRQLLYSWRTSLNSNSKKKNHLTDGSYKQYRCVKMHWCRLATQTDGFIQQIIIAHGRVWLQAILLCMKPVTGVLERSPDCFSCACNFGGPLEGLICWPLVGISAGLVSLTFFTDLCRTFATSMAEKDLKAYSQRKPFLHTNKSRGDVKNFKDYLLQHMKICLLIQNKTHKNHPPPQQTCASCKRH